MNPIIPTIDLNDFLSGDAERKRQFVNTFGSAYETVGFVAVKNHGLSDELSAKLYATIQAFFELPDEVKKKYEIVELAGQRGYTSKGREHAKGRSTGDLKEFYHIGQTVTDGDPIKSVYPENIFPTEIADFEAVTVEVYSRLENAGQNLMAAIALYLDLPEDYFKPMIHNGNSILRPIHYFPIEDPDSIPPDAVRAAEHEDINLITLLMGASAEGLEVLTLQGDWVPITALPDHLVVNCGDMLQRLTNNKLRSTTHRVVNPPREKMGTSRYSAPFFMHPRGEMRLDCLPSCCTAENPKRFADISAHEFLMERLREIGLKV